MEAFEYKLARSIDEAVALLAENGEAARPLAGGTDLLPQLRVGRRRAERLVDIKAVREAAELSHHPQEGLRLGASVPCHRIYRDATVARLYPALKEVAALIGGIQIQGRATLGGNLCNAAPSADAVPVLMVLGARCIIAGPQGMREALVEQFCVGPGRTVLQPGEFLVSFRIPPPCPRSGACYLRFIPRNEMDIAVAGAGAWVALDGDGETIAAARVALAAVAPTPLLARETAQALIGRKPSEDLIREAGALARTEARPITDMRGTTEQRRHLVAVLTRRALQAAVQRAQEAKGAS